MRLTTGLDDHLARRLLAGRVAGGGEFGVVSALGSGRVVCRSRTQKLGVLLCKPEGREQRDSGGGICEGNEHSFPPREFEAVVEPGHEGQ